ncbi:hypothetical protein [Bacillus xiamenensis]
MEQAKAVGNVALYMSAWIEILALEKAKAVGNVALYMSAWIEIKADYRSR